MSISKNLKLRSENKTPLYVFITLGILFALKIAYFCFQKNMLTVDSSEYIAINGFAILKGTLNQFRLPLYPLLIELCQRIFHNSGLIVVCYIQLLVSMLSSIAMYFTTNRICRRRWMALVITCLYTFGTAVFTWDKTILTESLSLSLTVFMIWGIVAYLFDRKYRYLTIAVVAVILGCMLRAVFAIYAGILLGFMIISIIFPGKFTDPEKKIIQRRTDAKGIIFTVIPVILVLVYAGNFYQQFGVFSLSNSFAGQQLAVVLQSDYYKDASDSELVSVADMFLSTTTEKRLRNDTLLALDDIFDDHGLTTEQQEEICAMIRSYSNDENFLSDDYESWLNDYYAKLYNDGTSCSSYSRVYRARTYMIENYDRARLNAFVAESKSAHTKQYAVSLMNASLNRFSSFEDLPEGGAKNSLVRAFYKYTFPTYNFSLLQGMLIGAAELIIFIVLLIKKKEHEWLHLGLAGFILSTGLLAIIGTNLDFARTAQTMIPFIYIAIALWARAVVELIQKRTKRTVKKTW